MGKHRCLFVAKDGHLVDPSSYLTAFKLLRESRRLMGVMVCEWVREKHTEKCFAVLS